MPKNISSTKVFNQLKRNIEKYTGFKDFKELKVMCHFELSLQKAIKANFPEYILQGFFFRICKAIWTKIKKLHLIKKKFKTQYYFNFFYIKSLLLCKK